MTRNHKGRTESLFAPTSLLFSVLFFLEITCSHFLSPSHTSSLKGLSAPRGACRSWHVFPGFAARLQGNICCCFQLSHCLAKILLCSARQSLPHITCSLKTQQRRDGVLCWDSDFPMVTAIQSQSLSSSVFPRPSVSVCVHCRVATLIPDATKSPSDKLTL